MSQIAAVLTARATAPWQRRCNVVISVALTALLSGCVHQWSITKIVVNPQPLSSTETVFPVEMVTPSQREINIDVTYLRSSGFNNRIELMTSFTYNDPMYGRVTSESGVLSTSTTNYDSATAIVARCLSVPADNGLRSVQLTLSGGMGLTDLSLQPTSTPVAASTLAQVSAQLDVEIVSHDPATNDYVLASAAKTFVISCVMNPPPIG